jgi:predicted PurR-regulated permease PerM
MSVRSATMNLHLTGNSGNRNRKWPRLAILATAAVLLSAISFIGVGGAIPQPQQAFGWIVTDDTGDATVDQSISQSASQSNTANQNQEANDNDDSTVDQSQSIGQSQSISQQASQVGNATD